MSVPFNHEIFDKERDARKHDARGLDAARRALKAIGINEPTAEELHAKAEELQLSQGSPTGRLDHTISPDGQTALRRQAAPIKHPAPKTP